MRDATMSAPVPRNIRPALSKTRLCKFHFRSTCRFGEKCWFAHSVEEMRRTPDFRRTKLCVKFTNGDCDRIDCPFAHGPTELRLGAPAKLLDVSVSPPLPVRLLRGTSSSLVEFEPLPEGDQCTDWALAPRCSESLRTRQGPTGLDGRVAMSF